MLYITFLVLIYLITRGFYLLTIFLQISLPSPPPPPTPPPLMVTNHKFGLFYDLFLKYNWLVTLLVSVTQQMIWYLFSFQSDHQCYLCHHTKILHSYWLPSPGCPLHACNSFILQLEVCTSLSPSLSSFLPPHPSPRRHLFVLCICFCFVMFVHLFFRFHV